ncbi:tryptophan synthase alpha chain [Striga asiatica]|uniref:Tryptophan synthase alpha chain n=1 Tax=Striga asiatica TaxID=4170 RepID=A0A5A7QGQ5_STRAF|nr:tryptophan synthase alpha chain [Striga asiatica]
MLKEDRNLYARELNFETGFSVLQGVEKGSGSVGHEYFVRFWLVNRNTELRVNSRFGFSGSCANIPLPADVSCDAAVSERRQRNRGNRSKNSLLVRDADGVRENGGSRFHESRNYDRRVNGHGNWDAARSGYLNARAQTKTATSVCFGFSVATKEKVPASEDGIISIRQFLYSCPCQVKFTAEDI